MLHSHSHDRLFQSQCCPFLRKHKNPINLLGRISFKHVYTAKNPKTLYALQTINKQKQIKKESREYTCRTTNPLRDYLARICQIYFVNLLYYSLNIQAEGIYSHILHSTDKLINQTPGFITDTCSFLSI